MVNFSKFCTTDNVGLNIKNALAYCKENNEDLLIFDKGIYKIDGKYFDPRFISISNHSQGDRKACFWLEGFENFTIDFGGSELVLEDLMITAVIDGCKNVTLKNFSVFNTVTLSGEGVIDSVDENGFTFTVTDGNNVYTDGKYLYSGAPDGLHDTLTWINEWDKDTGLLVPYQTDIGLSNFKFTEVKKGTIRADYLEESKVRYTITAGNRFCLQHIHRNSCGILINSSVDTKLINYTIHSTMGMGVIAQNSENIEIDSMKVTPRSGECHTLNADATHFVHCKGKIHIHDCHFERQLDDALNVHGIYLRITDKKEDSVILQFMHWQTLGVDTIKPGSLLETCDSKSLIPKKTYRVKSVNKIDLKQVEVFFEDDISDVDVGDNMSEVGDVCEVLFENNVCVNNRARAVLLASAGKTVLRGNRFESSGRTILFEANGSYWFESGGTTDVLITENTFCNCNYIGANRKSGGVIMAVEREAVEDGKYFHKKIEISNNKFIGCGVIPASISNAEEFIFSGNTFSDCLTAEPEVKYVKNYKN